MNVTEYYTRELTTRGYQSDPAQRAAVDRLQRCFDEWVDYKAIDILRTIRSFDPCMPCTTHVYAGEQTIVQEITTCACGLDD